MPRAPKQHTLTPIDGAFGHPLLQRRKENKSANCFWPKITIFLVFMNKTQILLCSLSLRLQNGASWRQSAFNGSLQRHLDMARPCVAEGFPQSQSTSLIKHQRSSSEARKLPHEPPGRGLARAGAAATESDEGQNPAPGASQAVVMAHY